MLRHALGSEPGKDELHWYTVAMRLPSQYGQGARAGHRATVAFPRWGDEFQSAPASTAAEAERMAFREALDYYDSWIVWDWADRRRA